MSWVGSLLRKLRRLTLVVTVKVEDLARFRRLFFSSTFTFALLVLCVQDG